MIGDDHHVHRTDRQRAFQNYKKAVKLHGKPFFPDGTWHDVVAATAVMALIIVMSIFWFTDANCGRPFQFGCRDAKTHQKLVSTPNEQAGVAKRRNTGEKHKPLLGPLYEEKADPGTTSYDPRPEWYFFFLFELLRIFANPQTVVLATIIVPTLGLVVLLAWPFLDRKRERRPSRRPIAMTGMVVTAIALLSLTWIGSKAGAGQAGGPTGLSPAQVKLPGYKLIFTDQRALCISCHKFDNVGASGPGPDLSKESTRKRGLEWQQIHLHKPTDKTPGSVMPPQSPAFTNDEIAQMAGFLETLGAPERASQPEYATPKVSTPAGAGASADAADNSSSGKGTGAETSGTAGNGAGGVPQQDSSSSSIAGGAPNAKP